MVKKIGICFAFMLCVCCSIAFADDEEVTPSPAPVLDVTPSLFDDEDLEEDVSDVDGEVDTEDADNLSAETAAASSSPDADGDSGDTAADNDSVSEVTPTPDPTVEPEATDTPDPTATPEPVTVFQITEQPESVYCEVGDTATFTCSAVGVGVTWCWKYRDENGWYSCEEATAICPTLEVEVTEDCFNRVYACTVEDGNGNQLYSDDAYLYPAPEGSDISDSSYRSEMLHSLGMIEGLLIFFMVVCLCYFSYKFLRIFF